MELRLPEILRSDSTLYLSAVNSVAESSISGEEARAIELLIDLLYRDRALFKLYAVAVA